jgi:hypothetical protein
MTNSDDDEESNAKLSTNINHNSNSKENNHIDLKQVENDLNEKNNKEDIIFKEKPVYKPNLVQRKPKSMPPPTTSVITTPSLQSNQSNFDSQSSSSLYDANNYNKWNRFNNKSSNFSNQSYDNGDKQSRSNDQQINFENRELIKTNYIKVFFTKLFFFPFV